MLPLSTSYPLLSLFVLLLLCILHNVETRELIYKHTTPRNNSIPAIFVFGDSTVDSGNNNYIVTAYKSDFYPYGKDFPNHRPTGRFTNGRLVTDFVAFYVGVKDYIPPYMDPGLTLDDLMTGVCFASAGTGFDPLTAQLNSVISIQDQLRYFEEYKTRMELLIGKSKTKILISKSAFLISAGTNDLVVNYYGEPIRRLVYTISGYQLFLLQLGQQLLEGLIKLGARKIAFVGLPPIGCVPAVISLYSDNALSHRGCIQSLSSTAQSYNDMLKTKLSTVRSHGAKIAYVDIYKPLDDMIRNPPKYGFEKVNVGCCGSGLVEAGILCNKNSYVCRNASKFLFWDSVHPTESAYYAIFQSARPLLEDFLRI